MEKTFKERVILFWEAFSKEEGSIRQMMDDKAQGETLLNFVDSILSIAFTKSYFEMGINKEHKYELILTPEGDKVRLKQLQYWQQMAPAELWEKWNFYSSKPASETPDFSLSMYGINLDINDVTFYPEIDDEKHKLNIEVYAPKLIDLDEDQRYSMFFIFLDQFIGELYTMEYIGFIDFIDVTNNVGHKATELKELINKNISEKEWIKPEEIGHTYSSYKMDPSQAEHWNLREDIIIGITTNFDVLNGFYAKTNEMVNKFEEDGLVFGFLFYENINIPQKEIVGVRGTIEDKILDIAESLNIANTIGGATGNHFSYMDFIIYDKNAFLEIAKKILSEYDFEETGFARFIFGDKPILFEQI